MSAGDVPAGAQQRARCGGSCRRGRSTRWWSRRPARRWRSPARISSGVSTASEAASGSSTNSPTWYPARSTHFRRFCEHAGEHGDQVDLGLEPRARHADRLVDPALLVDQVVLRDGVQQLVVAAEADVARHVVDPGDIAGADLVAGDRHHAVGAAPRHVLARDAAVDRAHFDAGHALGALHRLVDGAGGLFDVAHHAAADPARCAPTPTPRIRRPGLPRIAGDLGDHGDDLGGAEIERRHQPLRLCAHAPPPADDHLTGEPSVELPALPPLSGRDPAPPPSPLECPPPKLRRRTRAAAPRTSSTTSGPHPPRRVDPREQRRDRAPVTRASTPATSAIAAASTGRSGRRGERIEGQHPARRVHQRQPVALAAPARPGPPPSTRSAASPAAAGRPPPSARPGMPAARAPSGARIVEHARLRRELRAHRCTLAAIKILQSDQLHPPDPEEIQARGATAERRSPEQQPRAAEARRASRQPGRLRRRSATAPVRARPG